MAEAKETKSKTTSGEELAALQSRIKELEEQNTELTKKVRIIAEETEEQKIDRMCSKLSTYVNQEGKLRSGVEVKEAQKICKPIVETLIEANKLPSHVTAETIKMILNK
jgi:hypothetical protein